MNQPTLNKPPLLRRPYVLAAIVLCVGVLILFTQLGIGQNIIDPSEGFYAESAREMVESGNYLLPYLNYQPWFEKPILTYWAIAASFKMFGVSNFAARLPSAVGALITALAIFTFFARRKHARQGLLAAVILLTAPLFAVIGRLAITDMIFTCCLSLSLLSLFKLTEEDNKPLAFFGTYVALGLSILVKGPAALVLEGLILGTYMLLTCTSWSSIRQVLRRIKWMQGLALAFVISAPWFIAATVASHGAFFQEFFLHQNLDRMQGKIDHQAPWWFYIPIVAGGFFPWTAFIPFGALTAFRLAKTHRGKTLASEQKMIIFAAAWAVCTIAVFCSMSSKLPTYVTPAFPALAILTAAAVERLLLMKRPKTLWFSAALIAATGVASIFVFWKLNAGLPIQYLMCGLAVAMTAVAAGHIAFLAKNSVRMAFAVLLAGTVGCFTLIIPNLIYGFYLKGEHNLDLLLDRARAENVQLACVVRYPPAASFYLKKELPVLRDHVQFETYFNKDAARHWLLVSREKLALANEWSHGQLKTIDNKGKWFLMARQ